ncbi:hypothetical protein HU200_050617 [Digitaria exilis]|uniref:F-box domain-containing protein n=1 Tax=Digitaria exilis TaxID=1010633 RepID=A0A835B2J2_9POAL|nr:hypothetical protein HU200_050617 [Digitaria exilis]
MSGDKGLPAVGRRRSPAPAPPLDNDDLLSDILLRLPPLPSSLPRASLVCKRWRRLVSAPAFVRRFRARHRRSAPLLGFFTQGDSSVSFTSTLDPPDRLPRGHFSLKLEDRCRFYSCRHGLCLIVNRMDRQFLVWEPVTGDLRRVAFPPEFGNAGNKLVQHAAVLRAPGDVHAGEDHSIPFLVALVGRDEACTRAFACVYSSETGVWSNLISTACPSMVPMYYNPNTLCGSSLYWLLGPRMAILEFDLDKQFLEVIDVPSSDDRYRMFQQWVIPAEGGGLGFLCMSGYSAQLWMRKVDSDGIAGWVLGRTIELDKLLSLDSEVNFPPLIIGFAEEDNTIFFMTSISGIDISVSIVQLDSARFKKPFRIEKIDYHHPFSSVYTAGNTVLVSNNIGFFVLIDRMIYHRGHVRSDGY